MATALQILMAGRLLPYADQCGCADPQSNSGPAGNEVAVYYAAAKTARSGQPSSTFSISATSAHRFSTFHATAIAQGLAIFSCARQWRWDILGPSLVATHRVARARASRCF